MKKFFDGGEYFVLTSYRIKTVPIAEDNEVGLTLAKTIWKRLAIYPLQELDKHQLRSFESPEEKRVVPFIIYLRSEP